MTISSASARRTYATTSSRYVEDSLQVIAAMFLRREGEMPRLGAGTWDYVGRLGESDVSGVITVARGASPSATMSVGQVLHAAFASLGLPIDDQLSIPVIFTAGDSTIMVLATSLGLMQVSVELSDDEIRGTISIGSPPFTFEARRTGGAPSGQ